jgi:hypothetical protein
MFQQRLQQILDSLLTAIEDAKKFDEKNDSAGRRVRVSAQKAKSELQQLRIDIQSERNSRKATSIDS